MSSKECEEQLNSLIEAWQLDEADLNATDIYAIKHLLLKNQKQQEEIKAVNKGLRKVLSKRKKWKNRYYKEKRKNNQLKEVIEEVREDIVFCINGMKNEYSCTDSRTNRELHTMVKILEDRLQILDKAKGVIDDEYDNIGLI